MSKPTLLYDSLYSYSIVFQPVEDASEYSEVDAGVVRLSF